LIVIAAVLLILLVLVQNSKGGGLAAGFSSGNQVMGAPKTADFLEKASWTLAGVIIALSIIAVGFNKTEAFPIDVWMKRALEKYFPDGIDLVALGKNAGIAQQYLFYYERYNNEI
jgi:preprotein translocase subunit SecG